MNQTTDIALEAIAHGGEAIGRHGGKTIFVPYAIPGERIRIEIVAEKERWARGRLIEILQSSPDRVEPPCPYFGPTGCGGCQWQHIAYARQAEQKREIVADQLRRLGHLAAPPVADIIALADDDGLLDFGYRNHVQFALSADGRPGFRRAASHEIVPIDRCLLLAEPLDALHAALDLAWPELTGITLRAGRTGQALVLLEARSEDLPELTLDLPAACAVRTPRGIQPLVGAPWIEERVAGRRYRISAESFFQVNTVGAEALVETVRAYADVRPTDVALDLYCGVGLFALALADSAAEVIGVEAAPSAGDDFAYNAADLPHVSLHEGAAEDVLPALREHGQRVDVVVLDPPRAGAGEAVLRELAGLRPRRIVYVSCDPATLARDSVHLAAAGYRLIEVQPVDLFPQTYHVETVALWQA